MIWKIKVKEGVIFTHFSSWNMVYELKKTYVICLVLKYIAWQLNEKMVKK